MIDTVRISMTLMCQLNADKKKEIKLENDTFSMYSLAPGEKIPKEHHDETNQRLHCVIGMFMITIPGKAIWIQEGDSYDIPSGTEHTVENRGTKVSKGWSEYIHGDYQA